MMARGSEQFRNILHTRYLSHIHTTYSDGADTIDAYCAWAAEHNVQSIVFSDHVRSNMDFDFDAYCDEIEQARSTYPGLNLWIGAEAKILPFGNLDIPDSILPRLEVLFLACHAFPDDSERYQSAFESVFADERWQHIPRIWAHPGRFFQRREWTEQAGGILETLIENAMNRGILIENNLRDSLPPVWILKSLPLSEIIVGFDAHSLADLILK